MKFTAYTDGACSGNPGPGAAAAVLVASEGETVLKTLELVSAVEPMTTNQRQELQGAILALGALERAGVEIEIVSDSRYVIQGMTSWIGGWKRNGWRNSQKEPVANADLWQELDRLAARQRVRWTWVKGHSGHVYNDRCDELAVQAIRAFRRQS